MIHTCNGGRRDSVSQAVRVSPETSCGRKPRSARGEPVRERYPPDPCARALVRVSVTRAPGALKSDRNDPDPRRTLRHSDDARNRTNATVSFRVRDAVGNVTEDIRYGTTTSPVKPACRRRGPSVRRSAVSRLAFLHGQHHARPFF